MGSSTSSTTNRKILPHVGERFSSSPQSEIDPEVITKMSKKRFPNMVEEEQVVQAMDHCVQAMEAYIMQTHRLQWKPSDDAFIMCMEYVDELRKNRMEFVEKIQKRKEK